MKKIKVLPKNFTAQALLQIKTDISTQENISFTPREADILACLAFRNTNQEISTLLSINTRGVESHVRNIREKLNNIPRLSIQKLLEKSDKAEQIHPHYTNIQKEAIFLQKLEAIKKELVGEKICITCRYENFNGSGAEFKKIIQEHFHATGVMIATESQPDVKNSVTLVFRAPSSDINTDASLSGKNAIEIIIENTKQDPNTTSKNRPATLLLHLDHGYYLSFFSLLEILSSSPKIKKIKNAFCSEIENLVCSAFSEAFQAQQSKKSWFSSKKKLSIKKILSFQIILALAIAIPFSGLWVYQQSLGMLDTKPIKSDLLIPVASSFLPRPGLINDIKNHLTPKDTKKATTVVSIVGIGGSGKTTLARAYCKEQKKSPVVWEINAESPEKAFISFKELGYALAQTPKEREEFAYITNVENIQALKKLLLRFVQTKLGKKENWILIYDNLTSMKDMKGWFPHEESQWGKGSIIITTRNLHVSENSIIDTKSAVHLSVLTQEEQLALLSKIIFKKNTQNLTAKEQKKALVFLKELPPFPLDIALAAYSIKNTGISFSQYLNQLCSHSDNFDNLQAKVLTESTDYTKTRYGIVSLTIEDIGALHPDFKDLFLFMSLIDSNNIPIKLLKKNKNIVTANDFIYQLGRHGLLQKQNSASDYNGKKYISIHRNAQEIGAAYLFNQLNSTQTNKTIRNMIKTISASYTVRHKQKKTRKILSLIPHITSLLGNIDHAPLSDKEKDENKLTLLRMLGNAHQRYAHNQIKAYNYFKQAYDINKRRRLLSKRREARLLSDMATIGTIINDDTQALKYCNESLQICGTETDSMITRTQVLQLRGTLYRKAGSFDKGLTQYKKALKNITTPHVRKLKRLRAEINSQIAYLYLSHFMHLKEGKKAEKYAYEALKILDATDTYSIGEKELPSHFTWETGRHRWKYAQVQLFHFNNFKKAYQDLQEALYIVEKTSPHNMFIKGRILGTMGITLLRLKNYKEAEKILSDSINLTSTVLGKTAAWPQHVRRAEARIKLGDLSGAYEDCLAVHKQAETEKNKMLVLDYWKATYHAGVINCKMHKYTEAIVYFETFVKRMKNFCSTFLSAENMKQLEGAGTFNHPTAQTLSNKEMAREYLKKSHIILEAIYGAHHPFIDAYVRENTLL